VAPRSAEAAAWLGRLAGALVAWRLGESGFWRVLGAVDRPDRWHDGLLWAFPLLLVTVTAARDGLPIWGWL
jgi:hypothetical protein